MIWYLLYPLRGTTEPPRLSPSHPLRRAFQAHGTATARHWLLSLVLTITISVLLCYQAVFQADSPAAASLRNLPKHVWTSTTEIEGDRPADVVVRQVWVHGDYMKAIELPVLREAMHVQDALIGSGFGDREEAAQTIAARDSPGCLTAAAGQKWGYHSPLMYWDCSLSALESDQNLLNSINSRATAHSALNLTLRPSSLFAGKKFYNTKLRAADALVFTVFDQTNDGLGDVWDARSRLLAERISPNWTVFPESGHVTNSRLYEFHFRPMTLIDDLILAASYIVTAAYVILKMMQLRAVKSWFGLLVTICAKMTICIIASFSLCTYLGINLTHIPRPWFPAVVFCFGLGNIFRLINVVLETPPEMPPHQRIGNALGEVGHLSLAVAFQNLALLYFCSRLVSPWVADFCVFAAVTLVFDFVYHLTFFVAVLSVDVQRMELSDSLDRVGLNQKTKKTQPERQTWLAALREGTLPLSTRFAGSAAIFSIILAINWHFFDTNDTSLSLQSLRRKFVSKIKKRSVERTWSPPPINQARTPADWLRIQDHNTARELFGFIKPGAHSFVARIYDPLLVVSKGAYGRDQPQPPTSLRDGFLRFAQGHAFPAALIVVFLIAGVTLFMNYLLWTGLPETMDDTKDEEPIFSVKTLSTPQTLDIVRLVSCPKGYLSSVSLDRSTSVWLNGRRGYMHTLLQTAKINPKLWPIQATAMDDNGKYLALCTDTGQIGLWSISASRFTHFTKVDTRGHSPIMFSFVGVWRGETEESHMIVLTPDGLLTEWDLSSDTQWTKRVCANTIMCATLYKPLKGATSIVFVTKPGEVHISSLVVDGSPASEVVAGLDPGPPPGSNPAKIKCIQAVPSLGLIFALRDEEAEIFDFSSRALIHSFQIGHVKPHSFRVLHASRRSCRCGSPTVHSLSVAYSEQYTEHMIMQTFTLDDCSTSQLCLGKPSDREKFKCKGLDCAVEAVQYVEPAGVWESISTSSVIGIRRNNPSPTPSSTASGVEDSHYTADPVVLASALKQRARKQSVPNLPNRFGDRTSTHPLNSDSDAWEAWTLSSTGEFRSRPLCPDDPEDLIAAFQDDLFVASPGPMTPLGKRSVAVGFGNTVKIISLGKEVFQGLTTVENGSLENGFGSYSGRTRRGVPRKIQ
ncbi:sterol regulatory element-binding protein cleavage-activating protein [Parastagonospora nodorum]|nr:sterol regulatory element-binding protein cleavage-activating protein [Parastagonospora nodorum]KAH5011146.1 sterol regulatory element-binding protein cleavage-activating protein [Parastagonospora nodorum]KAH5609076.1 sterol regulatory element-binding protein cleavage-activating protein [Parastagonospora nodorum]KAH6005599.1 sterol regulatory element-binding protein cleavage-activating protein [Parastagonospora nodorum]KAH6031816.1 sterol regulatory element-binding protein cleavage-activatin